MRFNKLHEMIPYAVGGKAKILTMHPYTAVTLAMPGRHAKDTDPVGGDFVVMVDDETLDWTSHQFTHTDLFMDLETKAQASHGEATFLMHDYLRIIQGGDAVIGKWFDNVSSRSLIPGLHPQTFLYAVQALAVAEHRRYAKFEPQWGGRYLPFRFGAGIVEGLWTATDAAERQRRGRPGVEWLEKDFGVPILTKDLMS